MYSAYKLNKQNDSIQPWRTPFPMLNQSIEPVYCSGSNCSFLTCIQISQEAGKVVWHSHLLKNFPQFVVIPIVKGFNIVDEAEVIFLEFPCFLYGKMDVGNLISGSSALCKSSLYLWNFLLHILLKPSLKDFEHNLVSMWNEHNFIVIWTFFGIVILWDWNENWPFLVLWPLLSFPNLLAYWVQHFNSITFYDFNSSAGILSPPLALFVIMLPKAC